MSEIRSLVNDASRGGGGGEQTASRSKSVRFQSSGSRAATDSGVESVASESGATDTESGSRGRESWLRRLTEQRQLYYDNVNQLLNFMKNRPEIQPHNSAPPLRAASVSSIASSQASGSLNDSQRPCPVVENRSTQTDAMPAGVLVPSSTTATVSPEFQHQDSGQIPRQFQTWARSLQDERKALKEQNDGLKTRSDQLNEQIDSYEMKLQTTSDSLRKSDALCVKFEQDLQATSAKLLNTERELFQERAKNQQLRLDMDFMDGNMATLNKKFAEKTSVADASNQRCIELEIQAAKLEEQITGLQGQLRNLQVISKSTKSNRLSPK